MKAVVTLAFALASAFCVAELPAPHDQISEFIWRQGANLPRHNGVGDRKLRAFFPVGELDSFETDQDRYFEKVTRIVHKEFGIPLHYEYPDPENRPNYVIKNPFKKLGDLSIEEEVSAPKGGRQCFTVEMILKKCYGDAYEEQMIRALSARTLQFGGPMNEIAMLAKVNPVNIPVLVPGTPRVPFRTFAARYKIIKDLFPVRGDMLYVSGRQQFCETNAFDDLVSRYRKAYGVTPTFQSFVEGVCRSNDTNQVSYALFPLGIVVHRACDYTEEFAHFVNVGDPYGSRDFEEFKAAYHGAKVDAWKMGIDLGVSGGWAQYISALTADEEWAAASASRVPANTLLLLQLYVSGGGSADLRAWCESDAMGRMIL